MNKELKRVELLMMKEEREAIERLTYLSPSLKKMCIAFYGSNIERIERSIEDGESTKPN